MSQEMTCFRAHVSSDDAPQMVQTSNLCGWTESQERVVLTPQRSYSVTSVETRICQIRDSERVARRVAFRCPPSSEFYDILDGVLHVPSKVYTFLPGGNAAPVHYSARLVTHLSYKIGCITLSDAIIVDDSIVEESLATIDKDKGILIVRPEKPSLKVEISGPNEHGSIKVVVGPPVTTS